MKIKLSKSQWQLIGKTAGWDKKVQAQFTNPDGAQQVLKVLNDLLQAEEKYKRNAVDMPQMEEATQEDLDEGYGRAMTAQEYIEGLNTPYVNVISDDVYSGVRYYQFIYFGNYEPTSVNAGRQKKVRISPSLTLKDAQVVVDAMKQRGVRINDIPTVGGS
jgi:hypothetical protein